MTEVADLPRRLTPTQRRILAEFAKRGGKLPLGKEGTVASVAQVVRGVHPATVSTNLRRLERARLVVREGESLVLTTTATGPA